MPKKSKTPSPAEIARQDAAVAPDRNSGYKGAVESDPRCVEYIDAVIDEIRAGRSGMSVRMIHEKLVEHFSFARKAAAVREYIYKKHGRIGDLNG